MRSLRVVQFVKGFYIGGTEVQVIELLRGLKGRHVVSAAVLDEVGAFLGDVHQLGFRPPDFPLKGSFVAPNTLVQIARLASWLRAERVDLLHAQDFYSTLIAVPAAKLAGVKVVVSRLDLLHWHGPARSAVYRALTAWADHVVVNAEAVKRFCVDREKLPAEKITVIRNGLDLRRFDERALTLEAPLPETHGRPTVVHVANMSHEVKRQEDLLQAMRRCRDAGHDFDTFFVGGGCRRPLLEALARSLGVADRAHFIGYRTDAPAIQARATLGVLCSNKEGLSNAVMEGMAARLPMVVTDAGGNAELIADGERGRVVPPQRPELLAKAIGEVLSSPERARQMGEAGRVFVERELTVAHLVEGHERLYERLVEGGSANSSSR